MVDLISLIPDKEKQDMKNYIYKKLVYCLKRWFTNFFVSLRQAFKRQGFDKVIINNRNNAKNMYKK